METNSNLIGIVISTAISALVSLTFVGLNKGQENNANTLYNLPAFVSRIEFLENRTSTLRKDITDLKDRGMQSPTSQELAKDISNLSKQIENMNSHLQTISIKQQEVALEQARRGEIINRIKSNESNSI